MKRLEAGKARRGSIFQNNKPNFRSLAIKCHHGYGNSAFIVSANSRRHKSVSRHTPTSKIKTKMCSFYVKIKKALSYLTVFCYA